MQVLIYKYQHFSGGRRIEDLLSFHQLDPKEPYHAIVDCPEGTIAYGRTCLIGGGGGEQTPESLIGLAVACGKEIGLRLSSIVIVREK